MSIYQKRLMSLLKLDDFNEPEGQHMNDWKSSGPSGSSSHLKRRAARVAAGIKSNKMLII